MVSYNLSYTVVKGVHFCKDYLCKLSYLKKVELILHTHLQNMKSFGQIK